MKLKFIRYSFKDWKADRKEGYVESNPIIAVLNGIVILLSLFNYAIIDIDNIN